MPAPLLCPPALLQADLRGHVYIVTGGNSGIGLVTVRQLATQGATVVLACRRPAIGTRRSGGLPRGATQGTEVHAALIVGRVEYGVLVQLHDVRARGQGRDRQG